MKITPVILLGLLLNLNCFSQSLDTIQSDNSFIEYTGRIDFTNPKAPRFSYSGVSIRASFQGSSISAMLNDTKGKNYYNIILDKKVLSKFKVDSGFKTYQLVKGLTDGVHEIELFKLTEEMFGKTQFCGFLVDQGKNLVAISDTRKLLFEFIGNSITCGYGNEGKLKETFGPTTENHYLTYAAITSRYFNARHLAVCKSGIGIYRNYNGPSQGNTDCMPNYYDRIYLYDENPIYSFSETPDLICIDLGTNDFSTNRGDSAKYVDGYLKFIRKLQTENKHADIICLLGPMLKNNDLDKVRRYLKFIVTKAQERNKGKVYFFEMSQQLGDLGIGINFHPTVAQHKKNADELATFISKLKGWPMNSGK
jgi:lysophospholipase L1-like esterase